MWPRNPWIFSWWIFSQQGEPRGRHSWQSSPHHPAIPESPKIIQLEQAGVSPRLRRVTRTRERAEKKRKSRGKSLGEHSWKEQHVWVLLQLFLAGITTRDRNLIGIWAEGTMPDLAWGREDAGDASARARVNFPKNLLCSQTSSWGMAPPVSLPMELPHQESLKSPGAGAAGGRSCLHLHQAAPRGFPRARGSAHGEMMLSANCFARWAVPKNPAQVLLHPSSVGGGTGSHPPARSLFPSKTQLQQPPWS